MSDDVGRGELEWNPEEMSASAEMGIITGLFAQHRVIMGVGGF